MEQKMLMGKGTVEDFLKGKKMFMQLMEALVDRPIIGHTAWASSITVEQKARIKIERLKQISEAKGEKIDMATNYEAMVYLSTHSLAEPLSPMWLRIYFHLFKKFYPDKSEFIPDYEAKLNPHMDKGELNNLKRWLYKQSKA